MKVKCINNQAMECFLTKDKVYEVTNCSENMFEVLDEKGCHASFAKWRFEVVPSIDDVLKDKEWEKRANANQKIIDYKNQNEEKRTMNGLKVIELMQQGKKMKNATTAMVYWIEDGRLRASKLSEKGTFDQTKLVAGFKFPFNSQGFEEYIEPRPLTGWHDAGKSMDFFWIDGTDVDGEDNCFEGEYPDDNRFSTEEKAEEINFKQTLFRKLQRFSDENGGNEIDWSDDNKRKFFIFYCSEGKELDFYWNYIDKDFGHVYFISEEVVKQAIELFHDDLIKYFTHDWSEGNE